MGKIILFEGTDCSGKETQSNMLIEELRSEGKKVEKIDFPQYNTPTGKIVGGCYLGKKEICDGWFSEGATEVDAKVASLFFAADRRYALNKIKEAVLNNDYLILDRYTFSNMGHQGGKIKDKEERLKMYNFLETLEFDLLELPRPDKVIFLFMPYEKACILKKGRESLDQHELSKDHLINAQKVYLELCELYNFDLINCVEKDRIRTIEEIHEDVLKLVKKM